MPVDVSHFSMVGFQVEMTQAGVSHAVQAYLSGCAEKQLSPQDVVCVVKDPSGGELRLALRKTGSVAAELVGLDPAFRGDGRANIEVVADVSDPTSKPFETTLSARFAGDRTPLAFDVADPAEAARLPLGTKASIDLAAFSFEPKIYSDEAAFRKAQSGALVVFAPNFFVPSGMFLKSAGGEMPDKGSRPIAYADFAGTVIKAELRDNHTGRGTFWWAVVRTYADATIDVVLDPRTVDGAIKPGELLSGRFWLSAHVIPPAAQ
jgi:hypothetical protein